MIRIYNIEEPERWDAVVRRFPLYDIYYLSGYVKAFELHGDGEPQLLYYEDDGLKAMYVYMKRRTDIEGYYDSITPYGYGGVLFEGEASEASLQAFWKAYADKMREEGIVDNFVRYHPMLDNARVMKRLSAVTDLGKTIALDLTSPDVIWSNITSKNRNMIRKAEKNDIQILHGRDFALFADFKRIYNATMEKDHAGSYYFFDDAFYESIHRDLYEHYEMFYAVLNGEPVSMSIILFANHQMHYHLSGSLSAYRSLAPSNLLLYKVALWGYEQGYRTFHLGGGVGSGEDNLYKFKAAFNRNSDYTFSIGKEIFDQQKYDELVALRKVSDSGFDDTSHFFPLYRT